MLAIMLIPAAFCYTFGLMVKKTRQGWALLISLLIIVIPFALFAVMAELKGSLSRNDLYNK